MADFMDLRLAMVCLLVLHCDLLPNVIGVTLSPCGDASDKTAEVQQGKTDNTFTCSGLGSNLQVDWVMRVSFNTVPVVLGYCPASSQDCNQVNFGPAFIPSRESATESKLVINPTSVTDKNYFRQGTLECKDSNNNRDRCQVDYIEPAQGSCSIQTGTGSSRFELNGSCSLLPGAMSSRNRFSCTWSRSDGGASPVTIDLTKNNYQTECKLTGKPLPTESGQYTYSVTLFPGRTTVSAGTITIEKPEAPFVKDCGGDDYILENTTVECICATNTIGQPAGRLQWEKIGDSSSKKTGNYDDRSFKVTQILQRSDHQSSQFRCRVEWTVPVLGTSVKFNVGYPPTQVLLKLNNQAQGDLTVNEHVSVDFRCQDSNGRPEPELSLVKEDNQTILLNETKTTLSHVVVGRCEDSGRYVCSADNGMGSLFKGTSQSLFVTCSPRGNYDLEEINFIDDPVSTTFEVTAYPVPDQVIVSYLGPAGNETESSEIDDSQIEIMGQCEAKAGVIYQATCTVTVTNVTTSSAAGFYQVILTNTGGNGVFRLKVLYRAPSKPDHDDQEGEKTDIGPIIGGVIAAVVVVAVIIFLVIFIKKRRQAPANEKLNSSGGRGAPNGRHGSVETGLDNPAHEHDPEPTSASAASIDSHSSLDAEAPSDMYAKVMKPKAPAAAAGREVEAAGCSAPVIYAEVDKTKKKKKKAAPSKSEAKAQKQPKATPRKKGKKGAEEVHVYGNMDQGEDEGNEGENPQALVMDQNMATGRQINPEGLVYTAMDFSDAAASSNPPPLSEQGVLYSEMDFTKMAELEK